MEFLNREQLLKATRAPKLTVVEVPGLNAKFNLRKITGLQREKFESLFTSNNPNNNVRASLASWSICDEKGNLVFNDEKDVELLNNLDYVDLNVIYEACLKFNNMSEEARKEAAEKKS